jgi:hypothetical protein
VDTKIANFISYLFHPLLLPTYGTLLVFEMQTDNLLVIPFQLKIFACSMVLISTCLVPLSGTMLLVKTNYIKSIMLNEAEERRIPLMLTAVFYLVNYYFLNSLSLIGSLKIFLLGTCIAVVLTLVINIFWKISTHLVGIGGIIGMLIGLSLKLYVNFYVLIIIAVILAGLIAFSRIRLLAHTPGQVYIGFLIGLIPEIILFLIAS